MLLRCDRHPVLVLLKVQNTHSLCYINSYLTCIEVVHVNDGNKRESSFWSMTIKQLFAEQNEVTLESISWNN